jgi:hypothetical protein
MVAPTPTRGFGLRLEPAFPLPGRWPEPPAGDMPSVRLEIAPRAALESTLDAADTSMEWHTVFPDGSEVRVDRAADDALRFRYGAIAEYVVSPARDVVRCVPAQPDDPRWQRFLLDTVLWWTSLTHGYHVLHASAVEGPGGVALFASRTGGGKTTLALEFLRRGWRLFSDDVVALHQSRGELVLHPGPPLMNAPSSETELAALGAAISELDDETWLSVHRAGSGPRPLAAVFLYSRGPDRALGVEPAPANVLDLVPHVWDNRIDPERLRDRFDVLSHIVEHVPVYHLSAHSTTPPARIADLVADRLPEGSPQR